jgi:hypothetical protein
MAEIAAGIALWLGASLVLLSDGRRGLAVGVMFATAGLVAIALAEAGPLPAAAIAAGGAVAAVRRAVAGPPGWGVMPAGSTPRLVTCVAGGLVALWVGAVVMSGAGAAVRVALMVSIGLAGARVLWADDPAIIVTAVGVLAMAVAVAAVIAPAPADLWPCAAGAVIAAAAAFVPAGKRAPA